jgi:AcrR family transcriptional regulator
MGVSVEWFGAIADELKISRPALYNFAVDRGDLLFKCYSHSCDVFDAALAQALADSTTPAETLDAFLTTAAAPGKGETAVISEIDALPEDARVMIVERRDGIAAQLETVVKLGVQSGLFRPVDTRIVSHAVLGMASWAPIYRRWTTSHLAPGAVGVKELLFRGLAADPDAPFNKLAGPVRAQPPRIDPFDREALNAARQEAILAAAASLFNRKGIGATRVEDVGAAVGLSKRAIFHHIGHKDALVDACVARSYRLNLGVMDAAEKLPVTRLEATYAAVRDVIDAARNPELSILMLNVGFGLLSPAGRRAATRDSRLLEEGYKRILRQGQAEGSVREFNVDEIVASLSGVFSWAVRSSAPSLGDREHVADVLATLTVRGILA